MSGCFNYNINNSLLGLKSRLQDIKKGCMFFDNATFSYLDNFVKLISPSGWKSLKKPGIGDSRSKSTQFRRAERD